MLLKLLKVIALFLVSGLVLTGNAFGQIRLHPAPNATSLPVAAYQNIPVQNFRALVVGAFEASQFSLTGIRRANDEQAQYEFSYAIPMSTGIRKVPLILRVDENLDKGKKCASCFLRYTTLQDFASLSVLSWMDQYELSSRLFPAIDLAYAKIRVDGRRFMEQEAGFNYKNQWQGEVNRYGNSVVGLGSADFRAIVVDSYRDAGFVFLEEGKDGSRPAFASLKFSFPIDPQQPRGVEYKVGLAGQLDSDGLCNPCEMMELYDPHQSLPPVGLSGMQSRLTLESRFSAARALAFEKLKVATERYLRPRSTFVTPPKPAPLGSPRPPIPSPVVT
ncbi:hypothetical protein [Variovorax sp. OV329]|uniref:hypothetical protein n=1 Tax=Variovorax sp. OV329 TaxID=1882825 RepID=UPI0008F1E643|nr:hypothetical protein [Variovorax sp. OV329]SFN18573.1 hypothetical protein SAMN05444747_11757 [Variovorax sp. OV329]